MNKQKYQQGSGLLVIVIILAVALLGAMGYIFWQNFMKVKSDKTDNAKISTNKTLTISEWKLEGAYDSETALKYEVVSGGGDFGRYGKKAGDHLLIYSDKIGIFGKSGSTGANGCDNSIGDIIRTSDSSEANSANSWHIGNYYYTYVAPQSYCTDESGETLSNISEVLSSMREFFDSAKSIE